MGEEGIIVVVLGGERDFCARCLWWKGDSLGRMYERGVVEE